MGDNRLASLGLLLLLAIPGGAWGGLYNPCEMDEGPFNLDYDNQTLNRRFVITLIKYRACPIGQADMEKLSKEKGTVDSPFRQRYQLAQDLSSTDVARLTPLEKLSLSEYLIRRRQPQDAWLLLRPLSSRHEGNFLLLCNLATACQQLAESEKNPGKAADLYQQAIDYQTEALQIWPRDWHELSPAQNAMLRNMHWTFEETYPRCRTADEYFLKLLRSRHRLARRGAMTLDGVDPLFTDKDGKAVNYVGENGSFAPGKLTAVEKARFPDGNIDNALAIVQQLLIWLPFDARLYWQLGELYNARGSPGDLRAAEKIFTDLDQNFLDKNRKISPDPVKDRCQAFQSFVFPEDTNNVLPAGIADEDIPKKADDYKPIDWYTIGVSFGFGLIVALFAQWQIHEIRRRRQRPA